MGGRYTMYIPPIYHLAVSLVYTRYIPCHQKAGVIYHCIYPNLPPCSIMVYTRYIPCPSKGINGDKIWRKCCMYDGWYIPCIYPKLPPCSITGLPGIYLVYTHPNFIRKSIALICYTSSYPSGQSIGLEKAHAGLAGYIYGIYQVYTSSNPAFGKWNFPWIGGIWLVYTCRRMDYETGCIEVLTGIKWV